MIAVMAFPRTGSSMTAGILASHGVWTGEYRAGDKINEKGHFENLHFKQVVRKHHKTGIHTKPAFEPDPTFIQDLLTMAPTEPWLIKASAKYWHLLEALKPIYVCVRRNKKDTLQSCEKVGLSFQGIEKSYDEHMAILDELVGNHFGVNVDTDAVIGGNFDSLSAVFDCAGLDFDERITQRFVCPRLWHFNYGRLSAA